MSDVLPYKAEYAKSGRAGCKACKENIGKDSLRLAIMVQSHMFDGKVPNWFHFECFWRRAKVATITDIHGFEALRWEDQQKVKSKLSSGGASSSGGGGGDSNANSIAANFATEYAKSGKSQCRGCEDKIGKGLVRISVKDFESERAVMYGPMDLWHHVDCFVEKREEVGFPKGMDPTKIKGYTQLKQEDREMILEKLGKGDSKKRKATDAKAVPAKKTKEQTEEEKALQEQSKLLWNIRDNLKKDVSTEALKLLLEINKQDVVGGEKLLDRLTDCMAFGALERCPECKNGQLVYSSNAYHCTGNLTEWTRCIYTTQKPKRKTFKIPKEYHDVPFLKKYKCEKRDRVFSSDAVVAVKQVVSSSAAANGQEKPLHGLKFFFVGETQKPKGELTLQIERLGGNIASKPEKKIAACISNKEEVEKQEKEMKSLKKHKVDVVSEEFIAEVVTAEASKVFDLIKKHSICDWASETKGRVGDVVDGPMKSVAPKSNIRAKEESMFTKSVPKKMKMMVKGGAAVDPDSGLENRAHVYSENGEIFAVVLGLVDIVHGTNSYYKLQVLESDNKLSYWVFRAWGRVGTTVGGNKTEKFSSRNGALDNFQNLYADKTGNPWENRKNFVKIPNKFYPLEMDYGQDDEKVKKVNLSGVNSKLPTPVKDLIRTIFDIESMKKAMLEMEIDLQKMPLGKLSKKQLEQAYKVLSELDGLIEKGGGQSQFLDASNRFYTLIPHDFGLNKPPLLDTKEVIKTKTEMLNNLMEIEVAYSLLQQGGDGGKDPIDVHYEQLKSKIEPLEKGSEYELLEEYVKNTHAATHTAYTLEIDQIYKVARDGEAKKYKPFKQLHNRMLLWHGSRTTNFAGILSQGLRIAPPEAPVTGYMFGKGIYFADMVSKSANYCNSKKSDPYGLLLLCEVALGNMYERYSADYIEKLPKGMHSTKGVGRTHPDPGGIKTTDDGVAVPAGAGVPSGVEKTHLLYNEYIVYDIAQVNMKYLFKLKFNFKF